jgi:hypothetical protein
MGAMKSKTKAIVFAFRRPRFPVICDLDGDLFAAASAAVLQRRLGELPNDKKMRFVDTTGESWMLLPDQMILAPEFPMRRWRKSEIIRMFNESRQAREMGVCYPEHRLSNKRLDRIVCEIGAILSGKAGSRAPRQSQRA